MIKLYYSRIEDIKDQEVEEYLNYIPLSWHYDVMRYKRVQDTKSRLLARLMLVQCLEQTNKIGSAVELKRTKENKPYIENWYEFNISHSGSCVVFAYSDKQIGIDIEKKEQLNIRELLDNFHIEEKKHLLQTNISAEVFYKIWTKKEALLKAIGTGIVKGLKEYDCSGNSLLIGKTEWHFQNIEIDPFYSCNICTSGKYDSPEIIRFNTQNFNFKKLNKNGYGK